MGDQLANSAARCTRDVYGYSLLGTVTVCRRHADPGVGLVCGAGRRPAGQAGAQEQQGVLQQVMGIDSGTTSGEILSSSYYFRFYLARALDHAGMGDQYLASLKPWRELIPLHFSTWPETPGKTRSDSHAWSAHPAYDLLTLVAGIEPASPGFASVRIAPHLGDLREISAEFPHAQGMIRVHFEGAGGA
jgi:alpha-L-rhamnosidase